MMSTPVTDHPGIELQVSVSCRCPQSSWLRYPFKGMLRCHVAYYLPRPGDRMVVAEALDFPGAVSQGFDLADARRMIASAMEELAQILLEEGKPLPRPDPVASAPDADLIELLHL